MKHIFKKENRYLIKTAFMLSFLLMYMICPDVYFADVDATVVTEKIGNFTSLFGDILSSLGLLVTMWGISEWGLSWNESNGTVGSVAFKRIFGGIVVALSPQIVPLIV